MIRRSRAPEPLGTADAARRARFEEVFREVYEPLQRYARRRSDPASADDVVAEALTVVWRRLDDLPADMVLPWCYGVVRRCLANQRRGDDRRAALARRVEREERDDGFDWATGVDGELDAAMAAMPAADRELLHLWAWEGLQPREIAVVVGATPNAVSIRLHRAKAQLAAALGGKDRQGVGQREGGATEEVER